MQNSPSLLDLPAEVICELLRYLDATSLYQLAKTCSQLDELIKNHITLWRRIDARRSPNHMEKVTYCLERCYDDGNTWTHTLLLRGDNQDDILTYPPFFQTLHEFSKLSVIACENQEINGRMYSITTFPPQIQELSLKKTTVTPPFDFFKGSGYHFTNLRVLILDYCNWLASSAFMPISKYPTLEILSVYKCKNVENSIAYLSLSSQGFKSLKVFDARLSSLGNTLIRAMYRIQSLLAIYLQNEDVSYKLDYFRRKLDIVKGAPPRDFLTNDDEFDLNDPINDGCRVGYDDNSVLDDDGLIDYLSIRSETKELKLPQSVLYVDPYTTCSCGFEETRQDKYTLNHGNCNTWGPDSDDDDSDNDFPKNNFSSAELLTKKISQLNNLIRKSRVNNRYRRGLSSNNHHRNVGSTVISFNSNQANSSHILCMNLLQNRADGPSQDNDNTNNENRSVIKLYIYRGVSVGDNSDEPPAKKQKTDEPIPGPSGLNSNNDTPPDSDSETEEPAPSVRRPPTPHPDVGVNNPQNERSTSYRIYFRDSPIVQIENINDTHKDIKVPLRRLSLRGYRKITNSTLRYINNLDLDVLDLTYTGVTFEAVQNYVKTHPLCRVVHERFCTCLPNLHF